MVRALVAALIGFASGAASGAFGIGGALLSTPGIRWAFDVPARIAVGTTLPVIIPTALTGLIAYTRGGFVRLRSAAVAALAGGSFAVVGALTTQFVPGEALLVGTAVLILLLSIRMLSRKDVVTPTHAQTTVPLLLGVGAVSGFLSGLLGIGGGVIIVPILVSVLGFPLKAALGTSLAIVAAQAIPGTITHAIVGNIDWRIALGLSVGVIPGARIGSRLAVATEDAKLRAVVALAMCALALVFGITELRSLLR